MRICIFEDTHVELLEPLTLTRPASELWCGASSLRDKQMRHTQANEVGLLVRSYLAEFTRLEHPELPINDSAWLRRATVHVSARWLPPIEPGSDWTTPRVGLVADQVAYVIGAGPESLDQVDDWLDTCKNTLPCVDAGGRMMDYLWDVVDSNPSALSDDFARFAQQYPSKPRDLTILGLAENVAIADGAVVEPFVVLDTRQGPIMIEPGAVINSFSRIEGPCYVGRESWIVGAKLRGGTIGPLCRIGGEVEASIVQGYSNKYHDGFLGHSCIGSWVNLAAGTQTSDLRNDYGQVRVNVAGHRVATGKTKVGSFIGDHTKTALGALLNTGTVIGAFCNVLPSGALSPTVIPSFCQLQNGAIQERWDLRLLFQTAATVLRRRGVEWTEKHKDFFHTLYDHTAEQRQLGLRDSEYRRLRRV